MEHYLRFRPLRGFMDAAGARLVLLALSAGWFIRLWGLSLPALMAGGALAVLLDMALRRGRAKVADRREDALRRRLGGEMFIEELLLCPAHQADLRCAVLLCRRFALTLEDITDSGVLLRQEGEKLLTACLRLPPEEELPASALLPFARSVQEAGADRGVCCITGRVSKAAAAFADTLPVPLRLVEGAALAALGGEAFPATDGQLVALGRRQKRLPLHALKSAMLHPSKARRYLALSGMMAALYVITRLRWYPFMAAGCLLLAALCRLKPRAPERL